MYTFIPHSYRPILYSLFFTVLTSCDCNIFIAVSCWEYLLTYLNVEFLNIYFECFESSVAAVAQ